ncbi:MAG: hypothetical protein EOO75_01850, partial [Myxococcales bacterium]
MLSTAVRERAPIRPRHPDFDFTGLPRRWFGGLALPTHLANGANLLFPLGELLDDAVGEAAVHGQEAVDVQAVGA